MKKILLLALIFNLISVQAQEDIDLNENLLLYYSFDGNVNDFSNNNYHGIAYGKGQYTTDRFGSEYKALSFDGIDDFIELPNLSALKPELPITISFDIKYESNDATKRVVFNTSYEEDYNSGVFFTSQSSTGNYSLGFGNGDYNYTFSSRRSFTGDSSIETDEWHFLTIIVRSSLDMSIYVDGVEVTGAYSGAGDGLNYSNMSGVIGKHDQSNVLGAYFFQGVMNEFKYWNKALSSAEVNLLYNSYSNEETLGVNKDLSFAETTKVILKNSVLSIQSEQEIVKIEIYNILGKKLYSDSLNNNIDLKLFYSNIFIVKIQNSLGQVFVKKIAK